ncbi:hypothetical protein F4805DRAFT_476862 [Annulohypoxylon moriforme]|nr:hypothetical protein F4805DRAFT_476862 [Annulohypoxylon moriforme]
MLHKTRSSSGEGRVETSQLPDPPTKTATEDSWSSKEVSFDKSEIPGNVSAKAMPWSTFEHRDSTIGSEIVNGHQINNAQDIELPYISTNPENVPKDDIPTESLGNIVAPRSFLRDIWASPLPQIEHDISHRTSTGTLRYANSSVAHGSIDGNDYSNNTNSGHDAAILYKAGRCHDSAGCEISAPSDLHTPQGKISAPVAIEEYITHERDSRPPGPISKVWNVPRRTRNRKRRVIEEDLIPVNPNHGQARHRSLRTGKGDLIEEKWTVDGEVRRHHVPRYALVSMEKHAEDLQSFIDKNVVRYIIGAVGPEDDLLWQTYRSAFKHANIAKTVHERRVLQNLFRLWVALCKTSNVHHIYGDEKLGGEPVSDPQSPWFKLVPMPAVIIAQKECIIYTKIFRPLSKQILRDLQHLIISNKRQCWLTIYLSIFILMHSCAMITRRDEETARQYNLKERFANPDGIAAHHSAAQTMLAHFNYINSGFRPFQLVLQPSGPEELKEAGHLTDEQLDFVRMTALWIKDNDNLLKQIRADNNSGHKYYWISQMYQEVWKPDPTG